ncbi:hypothetical protein VNO78_19625 [Psophocarpus tetragonolobus]|uniref:Uncharacterized protein n=1 Tax=Psophocarpus tetragonolobus TaxID=3891 RepID=A0AAN9S7V0_PSOTE
MDSRSYVAMRGQEGVHRESKKGWTTVTRGRRCGVCGQLGRKGGGSWVTSGSLNGESKEEERELLGHTVGEERKGLGFRKLACEAQSMLDVGECMANTFSKGCVSEDVDERMWDKSSYGVAGLLLSESELVYQAEKIYETEERS